MRKSLFVISTILLLTLVTMTIASAGMRSNGWIKFASGQHQLVGTAGQEHIFVKLDNPSDLNKAAEVRSQTSDLEIKKGRHVALPEVAFRGLDRQNGGFEVTSTPAQLKYQVPMAKDGQPEHSLFLRQINRNGKNLLVSEPNSGSRPLRPAPKGKKYLLVDENLYTLDADTLEMKQLTKDVVGQYKRPEMVNQILASKNDNARVLHWVHNPHWNQEGTMVSYETNRDQYQRGMSIWVVNPTTGEEKPVITGNDGLTTIGWMDNARIAYLERTLTDKGSKLQVKIANVTNGSSETVAENVRPLALNGTTMIYREGLNIYSLNLTTKESTLLVEPKENQFFDDYAAFSPNSANVLLRSRIQPNEQTIVMVNLETLAVQELEGPQKQMIFSNPIWVDDNRIMVETFNWPPVNGMEFSTWIYQL